MPLEAQEVTDYPDRFELFTGCLPVRLFVDVQGDQAEEMGLTEERVRTMAESRLRAARLYTSSEGSPYLGMAILTLDDGPAFATDLHLWKWVRDAASGLERATPTWTRGTGFGTHGGDPGFIMQGVSEQLDRFILEYLRVNESYC